MSQHSSADGCFEIEDAYGAVLLHRADPADVCFLGRRHLGAKTGASKYARRFDSAVEAQAFIKQHGKYAGRLKVVQR